jgi:molybdopterin synthase catalytic subunit
VGQVTVLLFAGVAERLGTRRLVVDVAPGDRVRDVRDRLTAAHPQLEPFLPSLRYAVDEEYADEDTPVPPGATLALIPPVSGG